MTASPARRMVGGHPARAARVARALQALASEGWLSLSRVHRPGNGRRFIDHVLIGPGGIVVIDCQSWVGRIEVTRGAVQQNGFWREAETAEVASTAGSVAALLRPQHRTAVHALVCVAQHDLPHQVVAPGVHVVGVTELGRALRNLPQRLYPAEVLQLHAFLREALAGSAPPEQLTTVEFDLLPPAELPLWGLAGTVTGPGHDLFVQVAGRPARPVIRTAARRGRPSRPWRGLDWRMVAVRLVIAALVAIGVILLGPTVMHHGSGDAHDLRPPEPTAPIPMPVPAAPPASMVPAPYTPLSTAPSAASVVQGGVEPMDAGTAPGVPPAATAREEYFPPL